MGEEEEALSARSDDLPLRALHLRLRRPHLALSGEDLFTIDSRVGDCTTGPVGAAWASWWVSITHPPPPPTHTHSFTPNQPATQQTGSLFVPPIWQIRRNTSPKVRFFFPLSDGRPVTLLARADLPASCLFIVVYNYAADVYNG